ncbi:unnamed protein product [Mytilus edulis]|uniref:C-type lectin domain-containing protein n=1 Tax=Mytilus edulis TaxID=6550 RepID=A0A8S3UHX0_MYTED|nr:unnamed protein product [Mytilus edulis]
MQRNGSYLFGNIIPSEADAGNKINGSNVKEKTSFWHWLGIARKIYLTTDTVTVKTTKAVEMKLIGIQNKECVCLRHIPEDSGLSPHFCDGRCETYQQHFQTFHTVPNDCGSTYDSSIFNVYTSSPRTVTQYDRYNSSMLCLRLFCMDTLNVCHLVPSKCSNPFWNRICENNADNYALRNIATWEASVEICRNNGSYLYGNMTSSSQAIQTMKKFHLMKINNQFWLGAARQVYPTVDRGQHIETKEIVRCNLCTINKIGNGNKCDYDTDCNSRDTTAFAVCEDNIHQTKVIEYSVSTRMASLNSPIPAKGTDQINTAMTSKPQQKSSRRVTPNNIHNLTISRKPVPQTKGMIKTKHSKRVDT